MASFPVSILTPETTVFTGATTFLLARDDEGEFAVLAHHAPLVAALRPGPVLIRTGTGELWFGVVGAVLEVRQDGEAVVLAEAAAAQPSAEAARAWSAVAGSSV